MKISKDQLMEIIKEEFEKVSSGDVRKGAQASGKAQAGSGIDDRERGIIQKLQTQLTAAAAKGNITSGKALRLAQLLSAELMKMAGPAQEEPAASEV